MAVVALLLLAATLRGIDVWTAVDGTTRELWREPDVAGIARNFSLEGMNILYPRIDWRGDGPGFVESEFPLYPWTVACLYRLFGYHEEIARLVSYFLSLASCTYVYLLALLLLNRRAALIALLFVALNPLSVRLATVVMPEPLMFLCYVAGAYHFMKWCRSRRRPDYWLALGAVSLASLAKLPAIHVGILLACLTFHTFGWKALRRADIWLFAAVSVLAPALWYWHAHGLWIAYGNSLGMSNEAYLRITSGNFLQAIRATVVGNVRIEVFSVYTVSGLLLAGIGLGRILAARSTWPLLYWFGTLAVYYVVTGRTTGEGWAAHYHVVSLAPAALLIASGFAVAEREAGATWWRPTAALLIGVGGCVAALAAAFSGTLGPYGRIALWGGIGGVCSGSLMLVPGVVPVHTPGNAERLPTNRVASRNIVALALVLCLGLTCAFEMRATLGALHPTRGSELFACAQELKKSIGPGSLIVASGPANVDQYGLRRAYNAPYMFFWTRTKGFSMPDNEQSLGTLEGFRSRGARLYIAERASLESKPGFESELRNHYRVIAECRVALLLDLRQ